MGVGKRGLLFVGVGKRGLLFVGVGKRGLFSGLMCFCCFGVFVVFGYGLVVLVCVFVCCVVVVV